MIISILHLLRCSVFSYQRRFPVVYFTYPAMRRPRFVNKQLEVYALCVCEKRKCLLPNSKLQVHNYNSMAKQIIRKTPPSISLYGEARKILQNRWNYLGGTYALQEQVIDLIFRKKYAFQNKVVNVVKLKTTTLNLYYSTYIQATTKLATGIHQIQDLDTRLLSGDLTLVDDIANVLPRRNYSFATKFCACHNPKAYPIYDKIVAEYLAKVIAKGNLKGYHNLPISAAKKIMQNYMDYVAIYNAFMKQYKLKRLSYREVDWYIWTVCRGNSNIQIILTTLI